MDRVAVAMCVGLALTAGQAQAIMIDNSIPAGRVGHWSVDVERLRAWCSPRADSTQAV